jgi:RNA polymerase sigma-70 factor (ECF subfamily)
MAERRPRPADQPAADEADAGAAERGQHVHGAGVYTPGGLELPGADQGLYRQVDDEGLFDRARRGDEAAFSRLFAGHQRSIYRYGAYMCGPDAADDIVQDTFLAVLRQRDRHDAPSTSVAGYLFGIARHIVMKRLGARGAAMSVDLDDATVASLTDPDEPTALDALTRAETIDSVREAIRALPAERREAIVLCELQEMNYTDAAELVQCPVGTIRSRLHRAKAQLSGMLKSRREDRCSAR